MPRSGELGQPDGVLPVRLRTARHVLDLVGVHQPALTLLLQQVKRRLPVRGRLSPSPPGSPPGHTASPPAPGSDLVVVANVRTSWRRLPGLASCGTRTHATSVALPTASAATRSTRSTSSAGSPGDLLHSDHPFGVDQIPSGPPAGANRDTTRRKSRAQRQQCRTPGSGSRRQTLLRAHRHQAPSTSASGPTLFSRLQGVTRRDTHDTVASGDRHPRRPPLGGWNASQGIHDRPL
jgi:hypothetical protein